jgi:hypothetical protein
MKQALLAILFLTPAQTGAWFQQFAQVKWPWFREHPWFNDIIIGVPLSFLFIDGPRFAYDMMGSAWSAILIQYSIGIFAMMLLTYFVLGETLTTKNLVSLILSFVIVLIQILWK